MESEIEPSGPDGGEPGSAQSSSGDAARDRALGMDRDITRRDFLNGIAVGAGGLLAAAWMPGMGVPGVGSLPAPWGAGGSKAGPQDVPGYYPPARTGLRGSHPGSYEVGHAMRDGTFWKAAGAPVRTGEHYDLVVVGGGISGLSAAHFYRARHPSARILILDNHDDFGGHAKRNEFRPGGRLLLVNGGTLAIESPFPYSKEAGGLLSEIGIDPPALEKKCLEPEVYRGLGNGFFFDKETFGADRLVTGVPGGSHGSQAAPGSQTWQEFLAKTPFSPEARRDIARIQEEKVDYMPGVSQAEKKSRLSHMSYKDFLLNIVKARTDVVPFYQTRTHGLYGIGIDAVPALDCW